MRNLILTREKTFVACMMTMNIYIEDHVSGNLQINGVPCRKIGTLKNGEQKVFQIEDTAARIYVIADKLTKNYYNEFFDIPAGSFDVAVKGKNHYNPLVGNPFKFDGNESEEVLKNRKKNSKKFFVVMLISIIIGFLLGAIPNIVKDTIPAKAQIFSKDNFSIILTDDFSEVYYEGFEVCFGSKNIAVLVTKEDTLLFEDIEINDVTDYAELVIENNALESEVLHINSLTCFEYTATTDTVYKYFAAVFETDSDFWLVQFTTDEKDYDEYNQQFIEWAETVEIK